MTNTKLRRELAQQIRWLFNGRITNDQFDDFLLDNCWSSEDRAIREIAHEVWCAYSDTHAYRLRGHYAPTREQRAGAIRCWVFLRCGADYLWPTWRISGSVRTLDATAWMMVPLTAALMLVGVATIGTPFVGPWDTGLLLLSCAALAAAFGRTCDAAARRKVRAIQERFEAAGDIDAWPFLSYKEVIDRQKAGRLLAG